MTSSYLLKQDLAEIPVARPVLLNPDTAPAPVWESLQKNLQESLRGAKSSVEAAHSAIASFSNDAEKIDVGLTWFTLAYVTGVVIVLFIAIPKDEGWLTAMTIAGAVLLAASYASWRPQVRILADWGLPTAVLTLVTMTVYSSNHSAVVKWVVRIIGLMLVVSIAAFLLSQPQAFFERLPHDSADFYNSQKFADY